MRRARPLFLLAILGICSYLGYTYRVRIEEMRKNAPKAPSKLPPTIGAALEDWHWEKSTGDGPAVNVRAKNFRHNQEKNIFELEKMELKIFHKDGKTYDFVTSDKADFNLGENKLYADGDANITLGLADGEEPKPGRIIHIKASGVKFDAKAGQAETDRAVEFAFDRGEGKATGAVYDSGTRELKLKKGASLTWRDDSPKPRPMTVESDEILYKEHESKVFLTPRSKFTRGTMKLEGAAATVTLDSHGVRLVETTNAKGEQNEPTRKLEYAADQLVMNFNEKSEVEKIHGERNARVVTVSDKGTTAARTNAVDLEFDLATGDSVLKRAVATGQSVVESKPAAKSNAETRILRSDVVELQMREGGKEIAALHTPTPGVLEFLPNAPGQRKRRVEGKQFDVAYAADNRLESFKTSDVTTRTESEPRKGKPQAPALTWSKELEARFSPESGEMTRLEQWGDFRYEEGDRKARAVKATLDQATSQITLTDAARVWDASGSTSGDRIFLDQKTEDFRAEGNVTSSRLPDSKAKSGAMLSQDEPLQARAQKMTTSNGRATVVYEGSAVLWQGSSRLEANRIEIDRTNALLKAEGKVVSQLLEKSKEAKKPVTTAPVFTVIRAPALVYNDKERTAHYTGGVVLKRGVLDVTAKEIRAFLKEAKEKDQDSGLDKAIADGEVRILSTSAGRTRRGQSEHAEYFADEGKVILEQGQPVLEDNVRGTTRGNQLIYYSNDDRLLVNGVPAKPAESKVIRRTKQ